MLKKKRKQTETCISIISKIKINEKEIEQTQYFTENKQLKEPDLSAQMMQMNQLKSMIGEVNISEKKEDGIRHITIQNSNESPAKLNVYMQVAEYNGIEQTVFHKFSRFQENMQLFRLDLKDNEVLMLSETSFNYNGQEQKTKLELTDIKDFSENTEKIAEIDKFRYYKITNN